MTALKTLSLRIRGVKTELEEAGLETEGMAETTSQLQAKLKALTDGKVDIMVDANNFKNTTQILREMAAEWENLTDVEQAAALELLGGKRQANILASIINNFDIVEDAIEASANSEGSALEENAKVLDSIQGRINLFNNSVETMWNNLLDDEWIKLIVDGGTELVKLIDKFGSLRTVIFGILTYYSVFKKEKIDFASMFGIQGGKEMDYQWTFGKEGISGWVSQKLFPNKQAEIQKVEQSIDEITNAAKNKLDQNLIEMNDGQLAFDFGNIASQQASKYFDIFTNGVDPKQTLQIDNLELFSQELDKLNNMDNAGVLSYMQSLGDLGEESGNTAKALAAYASSVTDGNYSAQAGVQYVNQHNASIKASGVAAKAAAVGHAALNAAISMGISVLISAFISLVTKWINANKELAESVEEVMSEYNRATKILKDHHNTIKEIKDDYEELAGGVDSLGRNISLSTDEYERYNEVVNKIAEMFPEMVTGYTDEGNAIIGLKGNVEALTEAYEKEAKAARDALIVNSNDIFTNFQKNSIKDNWWKEEWNGQGKSTSNQLKAFEVVKEAINQGIRNDIDNPNWTEELSALGKEMYGEEFDYSYIEEAFEQNDLKMWKVLADPDEYNATIDSFINTLNGKLDAELTPLKSLFNAYLGNNEDYQELSDEGKNIAQAIISGFDTEFYARDEFKDWTDVASWIDTNVIQKLNADNMVEFNAAFNLQTQFNNSEIPVDEYISKTEEFLKLLEQLGFDNEIVTTIRGIFDIDDYETKKNSAKDILDSYGDSQVGTLSKSDLDIIDKNKTNWKKELELDGKAEMTWDNLINKIEEAKAMAWEASTPFDEISEKIDGIQDAYSALSDAVTQYNQTGYLTLDNLQALLSLEPEYLALLQMENGQLSINQSAMEAMIRTKLDEAKATAVQSAITQLNALANKTEADAINESSNAANNAISNLGSYADSLGIVAQNAIGAAGAVAALNAAVEGAQANELVDQSEIDSILANMNNQINLIDSIGSNLGSNFKSIVSTDKSSSSSGDSALEKLQKQYESKIKNLDNQQTYLQNEIDRLEAEDKAVSKSYYEDQIALEEKKLDLYKQEREALLKLEMTDEVADALWEVEHAIQDSTLRMVEFRQSIIDLYKAAFDDVISAYDNKDDFLSDQQNYIEKYRELMELQGEVPDAYGYQEQIANEEEKMADNIAELTSLRAILADGMTNGKIKEGSEEWIEMQDKIRAAEEAVLDNKIAIEEYKKELKQLSVDAFDLVRNAFSNKDNFLTNQQEYIQGYADLLEAQGIDVPAEIYDELIKIEQEKRADNVANLVDARQGLADIEAAGYKVADEEWQDAYQQVVELEKAVQDNDIAMAEYAKTIRDLDFEKFDRFIDRLNDVNSEIDNLRGLYEDEDVAFEDGTWTEEGLTSLGLLYQQMEVNKDISQEYEKKIDELNEAYGNGEMSEQEYNERLQDLKDGQWDAINAYEGAKDAIVDLEEARIDMIEEGINKEIEAYEDLIEVKKEELDAERDLYEFKKNIKDQTKDIAALERRIASLSGSTNASDIAEKRRLEAELYEAQEGLNDTYYGHSKDQQSKALDDEMDAYQKAQDKYLEMLRETLDNTTEIINTKIVEVLTNADVVLDNINTTADNYGVSLNSLLTSPWEAASQKSLDFKTEAEGYLAGLLNEETGIVAFSTDATGKLKSPFEAGSKAAELFATHVGINLGALGAGGHIVTFGTDTYGKLNSVFIAGNTAAGQFKTTVSNGIESVKTIVLNSTSPLTSNLKFPWNDTTKADGPISTFSTKVKSAIDGALSTAQQKASSMKTALTSPWTDGTNAVNTFSTNAKKALDEVKTKAEATAKAISNAANTSVPSYTGNGSSSGNTNNGGTTNNGGGTKYKTGSNVSALQKFLNQNWNNAILAVTGSSQLEVDGSYGPLTKKVVKEVQKRINMSSSAQNGEWNANTIAAMESYYTGKMRASTYQSSVEDYKRRRNAIPSRIYAKGTLGTKSDELAITDESWIGEEITLAAGKNGQLQYLKKGSAVMPADISANLVEWGRLNPDMMKIGVGTNLNMISNCISKPELNFSFDALVKAEKITEDTLPQVQKLVTQELDKFTKQLNYALKGRGAR